MMNRPPPPALPDPGVVKPGSVVYVRCVVVDEKCPWAAGISIRPCTPYGKPLEQHTNFVPAESLIAARRVTVTP